MFSPANGTVVFATNGVERVRIDPYGNVGIGTTSPGALLHIFGDGSWASGFRTEYNGGGGNGWNIVDGMDNNLYFGYGSAAAPSPVLVIQNGGNVGIGITTPAYLLDVAGQIRVQTTVYSSSRALKDNIIDLKTSEAMEALKGLSLVKYNYKNDPATKHIGFIAEDVPNLVAQKNRDAIDPMDIVAVLTKVVKEQQKTIDELSGKLEKFERQLNQLKAKDVVGLSMQ